MRFRDVGLINDQKLSTKNDARRIIRMYMERKYFKSELRGLTLESRTEIKTIPILRMTGVMNTLADMEPLISIDRITDII